MLIYSHDNDNKNLASLYASLKKEKAKEEKERRAGKRIEVVNQAESTLDDISEEEKKERARLRAEREERRAEEERAKDFAGKFSKMLKKISSKSGGIAISRSTLKTSAPEILKTEENALSQAIEATKVSKERINEMFEKKKVEDSEFASDFEEYHEQESKREFTEDEKDLWKNKPRARIYVSEKAKSRIDGKYNKHKLIETPPYITYIFTNKQIASIEKRAAKYDTFMNINIHELLDGLKKDEPRLHYIIGSGLRRIRGVGFSSKTRRLEKLPNNYTVPLERVLALSYNNKDAVISRKNFGVRIEDHLPEIGYPQYHDDIFVFTKKKDEAEHKYIMLNKTGSHKHTLSRYVDFYIGDASPLIKEPTADCGNSLILVVFYKIANAIMTAKRITKLVAIYRSKIEKEAVGRYRIICKSSYAPEIKRSLQLISKLTGIILFDPETGTTIKAAEFYELNEGKTEKTKKQIKKATDKRFNRSRKTTDDELMSHRKELEGVPITETKRREYLELVISGLVKRKECIERMYRFVVTTYKTYSHEIEAGLFKNAPSAC